LDAFLQKFPFASAQTIAKHSLVSPHTVKEILQKGLGMRKFSRCRVPHSLTSAQTVPRADASIEMLRILQESKTNDFDAVTTGDEFWFQYIYPSSEMFTRSPADVIPKMRQAIGAKMIMIRLFFTARKLIVRDIMPKGWKYNQLSSVQKVLTPHPLSINISNIKHIFILSDNMSSMHHKPKTKTETYSSNVLVIVNLPVVSSLPVTSQSWTKSNRDSLSLFSSIVKRWIRKFKNGDLFCDDVLVDPSQYLDHSCGSSLIGILFQAPELYQDTFVFLL
jgi:hypothetical protein